LHVPIYTLLESPLTFFFCDILQLLHKELEKLVKSVIPDLHVRGHLAQAKGMSIKDIRIAAIKAGSARCFSFVPNPTVVPHDPPAGMRNNFPKPPRKEVTDPTSEEFNSPFSHPLWVYRDFKAQREKVLSDEIELEKLRAAVKTEESFWKGGCNYAKMGVRDCAPVGFESKQPGSSAVQHQQQTVSHEWPTLPVPVIAPDIEPRPAVIACNRQVSFVSATNGALPCWSEFPVHSWDVDCNAFAEERATTFSAAEKHLAAMDAAARSPVSGHYMHANDDGIIRGPYSPPTPVREAEDKLKRMRRASKNLPSYSARVVPPPSRSLLRETVGELSYTTQPVLRDEYDVQQAMKWPDLSEQVRLLAAMNSPQNAPQAVSERVSAPLQRAAPQHPHLMINDTELFPKRMGCSRLPSPLRLDEDQRQYFDAECTAAERYAGSVEARGDGSAVSML